MHAGHPMNGAASRVVLEESTLPLPVLYLGHGETRETPAGKR